MDDLDNALLDAWQTVSQQIRNNPTEARRRAARRFRPTLQRPIRCWCLTLRASDTRINPLTTCPDDPQAVAQNRPHTVTLYTELIQQLNMPIQLDYPGVDWTQAANQLGRHPETIRAWIRRGLFNVDYYNAFSVGKTGKPVPYIWSPSPIDPNSKDGQPPDPIWGTIWQSLWERTPRDVAFALKRIPQNCVDPRGSNSPNNTRHRGWKFICPGRLQPIPKHLKLVDAPKLIKKQNLKPSDPRIITVCGNRYIHTPCRKQSRSLFMPLPVWTIPQALGQTDPFAIESDLTPNRPRPRLTLAGSWTPGQNDTVLSTDDPLCRNFACQECWDIQYFTLVDKNGWNKFIAHITGGLLYGNEVQKPIEFQNPKRKRAYIPRKTQAPRLEEAQQLLLDGLTYQQIANRMNTTRNTTASYIKRIYVKHNVHSKEELLNKLNPQRHPDDPIKINPISQGGRTSTR